MPQLRPVEKYWASMKHELHKKGKIIADINQFCRIWGVTSRNFTKMLSKAFKKHHLREDVYCIGRYSTLKQ